MFKRGGVRWLLYSLSAYGQPSECHHEASTCRRCGEQGRQRRIDTIACPNATSSMNISNICLATADDLRHFWYWQLSSCISDLTQNGSPEISVTVHLTSTGAFSTARGLSSMHFSKVAESPPPPLTIPKRLVYRRLKRGKTFDRPWQP